MTATATELQRDERSWSAPADETWKPWLALPVVLAGTFVVTLDSNAYCEL